MNEKKKWNPLNCKLCRAQKRTIILIHPDNGKVYRLE